MLINDELKLNIDCELDNEIKYIKINDNNKTFQIQLLSNDIDKQQGFDSYIYTDNPKATALEIINSIKAAGLVSIDLDDLIRITNNKSLDYYSYKIADSINYELIDNLIKNNNININNKKGLVVIHNDKELSLKDINEIINYFKTDNFYYSSYTDNNLKDNEVVLSLLIER